MSSTTNSTDDDKNKMLVAAGFSRLFSDVIKLDDQNNHDKLIQPPLVAKEVKGWTFTL